MNDLFGEVIYSYTRKQALQDGVLVDVSATAKEAGFTLPVAVTRAVWVDCVEWPEELNAIKKTVQDEAGRLWDVVYMASVAARQNKNKSVISYRVLRVPTDGTKRRPREVELKMIISGGDHGEPVITICQPNED